MPNDVAARMPKTGTERQLGLSEQNLFNGSIRDSVYSTRLHPSTLPSTRTMTPDGMNDESAGTMGKMVPEDLPHCIDAPPVWTVAEEAERLKA